MPSFAHCDRDMPNLHPHDDFVLPGWATTPLIRTKCLLSLASAHSRKVNPRNLGYPWYEPWVQILQGLVADIPELAVAPQSYLWYYRCPRPGDHQIEPPSARTEDDGDDMLVDSIESIRVGSRHSRYQLVDLAITRKVLRNQPAAVYPPQARDRFDLSQSVDYMGIPVLCELKRGGMYH
jgi:hypothetical protein